MFIRIAFSIELRLRVSRSLRSLVNKDNLKAYQQSPGVVPAVRGFGGGGGGGGVVKGCMPCSLSIS